MKDFHCSRALVLSKLICLLLMQVVPSLKVSVKISPSPLHLQEFLLRLDVENQNSTESTWLRQVSCAGDRWCLAPLLPPVVDQEGTSTSDSEVKAAFLSSSVCASQLLPASQSLSLFFKLSVSNIYTNFFWIVIFIWTFVTKDPVQLASRTSN